MSFSMNDPYMDYIRSLERNQYGTSPVAMPINGMAYPGFTPETTTPVVEAPAIDPLIPLPGVVTTPPSPRTIPQPGTVERTVQDRARQYNTNPDAIREMLGHDLWARGRQSRNVALGDWEYDNAANQKYEWWGGNKNYANTRQKGHSALQRVLQFVDRYFNGKPEDNIKTRWGANLTMEQAFGKAVEMLKEQYTKGGHDFNASGFRKRTA